MSNKLTKMIGILSMEITDVREGEAPRLCMSKDSFIALTKATLESIAQECYLQCLAVECGEEQCAEAIAETFPFISRYQQQDEQ